MVEPFFSWFSQAITLWPAVLLFLVAGVAGLKYGADWLVDGAANLGFRFGMGPAAIGLTIVAFGTSAPELVVSVLTAMSGQGEICLGNVIGSNIANTTLILGATALVFPLSIQKDTLYKDAPISLGAIALVMILAFMGSGLSRLDGALLLVIFSSWMGWMAWVSLRKKAAPELVSEDVSFHQRSPFQDLVLIGVGLFGLVVGADMLVQGAVASARALEVPEVVVGLTVVAGGTSLPELAVCLVAAMNHKADLTVGNVFGSNIFNALLILGVCLVIAPIPFDTTGSFLTGQGGTLYIDIPFCVFVALIVVPLMVHRRTLGRYKGIFLTALYVGYLVTLVLRNTH